LLATRRLACTAWFQVPRLIGLCLHGRRADVHAKDNKKKNTPLHVACEKGFIDVMKLLVEAGANLKANNKAGEYLEW
jgi:hypothetical protein